MEYSASPMKPLPIEQNIPGRTIILCFDGTGNKFGENSNIVRLFSALVKDKPDRQIVYYQPGIGTYNKHHFFTRSVNTVVSTVDQAIALDLSDHVKEGYQFIMKNYRRGDKICLFGFSRGAHTARVLAGMLYKVGLLPAHNDQQVDFAFSVYQTTGAHGVELSKEFKRTFAISVTVEFLGVWDTVSSVGIIPRQHPYTSVNYSVKTVRHALALDEHRARFRPQTWHEPTTIDREQDLDVDDPNLIMKPRGDKPRDDWTYEAPDRTTADVKEVWFAGAHADVGGGSHNNKMKESLSFIPLRWMIKECLISNSGILFDQSTLVSLKFDLKALRESLANELSYLGLSIEKLGFSNDNLGNPEPPSPNPPSNTNEPLSTLQSQQPPDEPISLLAVSNIASEIGKWVAHHTLELTIQHAHDAQDCIAKVFDQLETQKLWWILELLPTLTTYQRSDGVWIRQRMRNFGQGRYIPFSPGNRILVHKSVKDRIDSESGYTPKAFNWENVVNSGMLQYVY